MYNQDFGVSQITTGLYGYPEKSIPMDPLPAASPQLGGWFSDLFLPGGFVSDLTTHLNQKNQSVVIPRASDYQLWQSQQMNQPVKKDNTMLYVGLGLGAVTLIAITAIVARGKG